MRATGSCVQLGAPVSEDGAGLESVLIGLGSNLGDRANHLMSGVEALRRIGDVMAVSNVYETDPVGVSERQPAYLNMVVSLATEFAPSSLLDELLCVERIQGRHRQHRNAPRTLDLDLLAYGDLVLHRQDLTVPHPRLHERAFVLVPLMEVAPGFRHPVTGATLPEMMAEVQSQGIHMVGAVEGMVGATEMAV